MIFLVLAISSMDVYKKKFYHCEGGNPTKETSLIPKVDWSII
jgi:hypothetical protein